MMDVHIDPGQRHKSSGFTLIEIAIVMVIIGLLISSLSVLATGQLKSRALNTTRDNLQQSELALRSFLEMNGRYPCPAGRQAKRGDKLFGKAPETCETDKNFSALAPKDKNIITAPGHKEGEFVKIGILPFRSLGMSDAEALDGWGRVLQYAVSEKLTDSGQFDQRGGTIDVVAEDDQSRVTPKGSVQYVIFSTGEDGKGGYSGDGTPLEACPQNLLERVNCDDDATFMDTYLQYVPLRNSDGSASRSSTTSYDDYIAYQQFDPAPNAKGGIMFFYYKECPANFAEVDTQDHDILDVATLSKDLSLNGQGGVASEEKLCFSSRYAVTMTLLSENGASAKGCPVGWTEIGYKLFATKSDMSMMRSASTQGGSVNNLVCAR